MRTNELGPMILIALVGCGGSADPGTDGGPPPVDAFVAAEDSGSSVDAGIDAAAPDASAPDASTGSASVVWVTEIEPRDIDGDIALEYGLQYTLAIDGDPFVYSLMLERCIAIAGTTSSCDTGELSNLPGDSFVRFGIDPSMYAIGENHYTFHLMLSRGTELVSEDTLDIQLNVTSCETCGGGSGAP